MYAIFCFFYKGNILENPIDEFITPKATVNHLENVNNEDSSKNSDVISLYPIPNSKLNDDDKMSVLKKINGEIKIDSVVSIIYELNPLNIKNQYQNQKKNYSTQLYNANMDSFTIKNKDTLYTNLLTVIADYK